MFVEHPGNAGRPHAAAHRPIPSLHRPSGWSRSFVLASLRALHLDQRLPAGARGQEGLDGRGHTGNSPWCSNTIRTARSRTSGGYGGRPALFRSDICSSPQGDEQSPIPGRFSHGRDRPIGRGHTPRLRAANRVLEVLFLAHAHDRGDRPLSRVLKRLTGGLVPVLPVALGRCVAAKGVNNSLTKWPEGAEVRRATPCVSVPS